MDQLIFASLSHTHYGYEVGMLKVPAVEFNQSIDQSSFSGLATNPLTVSNDTLSV